MIERRESEQQRGRRVEKVPRLKGVSGFVLGTGTDISKKRVRRVAVEISARTDSDRSGEVMQRHVFEVNFIKTLPFLIGEYSMTS